MSLTINSIQPTAAVGLNRFLAQPKSGFTNTFSKALDTAASAATTAVTGGLTGIDSSYSDVITMQLEAQKQMMSVTLVTNLERTRHETQMAPARNLRVA